MRKHITFASLLSFSISVSGHSIFQVATRVLFPVTITNALPQELYVNGVSQGHLTGIRVPDYDGVR